MLQIIKRREIMIALGITVFEFQQDQRQSKRSKSKDQEEDAMDIPSQGFETTASDLAVWAARIKDGHSPMIGMIHSGSTRPMFEGRAAATGAVRARRSLGRC